MIKNLLSLDHLCEKISTRDDNDNNNNNNNNNNMTIIPIVVEAIKKKMKVSGRIEAIQTIALLKSARIIRKVLQT